MTVSEASSRKSLWKAILPQLILLSVVAGLYVLSLLNVIPSPKELNQLLMSLFLEYGLPIIATASFLESLIGINAYFPGAFTILTGMSLTAGDLPRAFGTYLAIYIPALAANVLSFLIGRRRNCSLVGSKHYSSGAILIWFITTYWHPQLAAVTAFTAGVRG